MTHKKIIITIIAFILVFSTIITPILAFSSKNTNDTSDYTNEVSVEHSSEYQNVAFEETNSTSAEEMSLEETTLDNLVTAVSNTSKTETTTSRATDIKNTTTETVTTTLAISTTVITPSTTQPPPTTSVTTTETTTTKSYGAPSNSITSLERAIVNEINEYRATLGLYPLSLNSSLSNFSAIRAKEASINWSHTRPDGRKFHTIFTDYNLFTNTRVSEILAKVTIPDAKRVLTRWNESPSHHSVIVTTIYDEIGIAVYEANGYVYVAAHAI